MWMTLTGEVYRIEKDFTQNKTPRINFALRVKQGETSVWFNLHVYNQNLINAMTTMLKIRDDAAAQGKKTSAPMVTVIASPDLKDVDLTPEEQAKAAKGEQVWKKKQVVVGKNGSLYLTAKEMTVNSWGSTYQNDGSAPSYSGNYQKPAQQQAPATDFNGGDPTTFSNTSYTDDPEDGDQIPF